MIHPFTLCKPVILPDPQNRTSIAIINFRRFSYYREKLLTLAINLHTHPPAHGISSDLPVLNILNKWNHLVQAVSGFFFLDNSLFTKVSCFFSLWILGLFPLVTIANSAHLVFLWGGETFLNFLCVLQEIGLLSPCSSFQ